MVTVIHTFKNSDEAKRREAIHHLLAQLIQLSLTKENEENEKEQQPQLG